MIIKKFNKLKENIESFDNNSLLIRYTLAFAVFYSHMFAVYGLAEPTLFWGLHSIGWYGVNGFFFISGILVAQSYVKKDLIPYIMARILRILPAYIAALVISIVAAMLFGSLEFSYVFILKSINFILPNLLPINEIGAGMIGAWNASQSASLNNSIWTIPFEVFCYMFIIPIMLLKIKLFYKFVIFIVSLYFIYKLGAIDINGIRLDLIRVFFYFAFGVAVYSYLENKNIKTLLAPLIALFLIYITESSGSTEFILNFLFISIILYIGFYFKSFISLKNDLSYGIYLYAWPISQAINGVGIQNIYIGLCIALVVLFVLSYLSWRYLEKPFLSMKNKFKYKISKEVNV